MGKHLSDIIGGDVLIRLSKGDKSAFRRVYDIYEDFIRSAIKRYIPDEEECNELTQQIFISLWEKRGVLSDVRSFQDYLYIVTRNKVFKYFTNLRKEAQIIRELQHRQSAEPRSTSLTVELREYYALWEHAVQLLPTQQKSVYTMIEQQEESLESVAKQLGLARGTVKKHLELARKAVRKFISSQLQPDKPAKAVIPLAILSLFIF